MEDSPAADSEPQVEEQNTAAYSLSEVSATVTEPDTGLYNEGPEGEKPMDMETNNLPTERDEFAAPPAAAAAVMGGGDGDVAQLVQELAGRIASLETRLDEANDSRERLERQVAAQSEELRVQRAAIARTQRALRSLSRTEEDQATEPALREPSQPAG
jgi:septal ring factor EnvC (AmiA/AmiB activator)